LLKLCGRRIGKSITGFEIQTVVVIIIYGEITTTAGCGINRSKELAIGMYKSTSSCTLSCCTDSSTVKPKDAIIMRINAIMICSIGHIKASLCKVIIIIIIDIH